MKKVLTALFGVMAVACMGPIAGVDARDKAAFGTGANDPRSNAALNIEAAKRYRASKARPDTARRIRTLNAGTVNNPAADATAQDTQSETTIASVGGTNLVAAWNDSGSFLGGAAHFTGYAFSSNNGQTWTDAGALPASVEGDAGDPVLAYDPVTGEVYLVTLGFNTGESLQVFKSTDSGHTFGAPVNGTPGFAGSGEFQDKPWMTVDSFAGVGNGNIYLCWTDFFSGGAEIRMTRSTDHGATFGPVGLASPVISAGGQGCFVVVSPNHQVNAFFYRGTGPSGQGGDNKLFVRRSTDFGVTFAAEVQIADLLTSTTNGNLTLNGGVRSNSFPHAAVNPVAAKPFLYAVYNDDPTPGNTADDNANVFSVRSTDGGLTWSAPVNIDNSGRDQFFPTIGFQSGGGQLLIGYYSRVQDPDNLFFHRRARLGRLNNAGAVVINRSFQMGPNTPIVIGQDPVINATYMGDYDQISGGNGRLFSTWADNRSGNGFHANQPDVYSATIAVPPAVSDISVATSAFPTTILVGNNSTVTATASSTGGTSKDVFVNLRASAGLAFQSASVPGGTCTVTGGGEFVGCSAGSIAAGGSKNVTAVVQGVAPTGVRTVFSEVSTSSKESVGANNTDNATITVN